MDPRAVFERVVALPGVAFLDGSAGLARAPFSHLAWQPRRRLRVETDGSVRIDGVVRPVDPLPALDEFLDQESKAGRTVIGAIGYDLRHWLEPACGRPRGDLPVLAVGSYAECFTFDHRRSRWLQSPPELPPAPAQDVDVSRPLPNLDLSGYGRLFGRLREWIAAGDVYQANLSIAFDAAVSGAPAALYLRLAATNPVPYGAFLDFGDFQLLGNSPELFLERRGREIATRPIKGTRPRGRDFAEDERLARELRADAKERAEHLMIVDLERNDLGRIAETGSVRVEEFEAVERYATLHHMESTIRARLREGLRFSDVLKATFPGGSITGAPKIRAMQILDELEPEGRGFYTGAVLHHPPDGDFTMNIAIRTAIVRGRRIRYPAGGGVVADSLAENEYRECLLKARAFFAAAGAEPCPSST